MAQTAKNFEISSETIEPIEEKPYAGDANSETGGGYFDDVDGAPNRVGTTEGVQMMTPEERQEKLDDFAFTIIEGINEILDAVDAKVQFTEAEKANLADKWGDVAFHYVDLQTPKSLDVAMATLYTSSLAIKKSKEYKDKKKLQNSTPPNEQE